MKEILKESGRLKVKIEANRYGYDLLTTENGYQWTGQSLLPEKARLIIEALQEYLSDNPDLPQSFKDDAKKAKAEIDAGLGEKYVKGEWD